MQKINTETDKEYSGDQRNISGYFFIDDFFTPMQSRGKKKHPEKTAQQNEETGEESGNICRCVCLYGKQCAEHSSPPDNRHRAGNSQNIAGDKGTVEHSS